MEKIKEKVLEALGTGDQKLWEECKDQITPEIWHAIRKYYAIKMFDESFYNEDDYD